MLREGWAELGLATEVTMKHRPIASSVVALVLGASLSAACVVHDEPNPPSQDTGASDPDCNQAFQDALEAGLCQPPAKLVINFDLGSTNYIYIDDPYFEAVGAVGVFGPGAAAGAGGAVGGIADSVAHVIESNGSCEILCAYDIVTCNDDSPICLSLTSGCLYCNDDDVTIEQCEAFLSACTPEESMGSSGDPGTSDHGADSTT